MAMKILCVYSPDFKPLADITIPLWDEYTRRHKYKFHTYIGPNLGQLSGFHYSFFKMKVVLEELENQPIFDPMLVIDLDMIPTNFTIPIGGFCSDLKDITITRDINGLNSGAFFIFKTPIAEMWLRSIISLRHHTTSEQHAMWWLQEAYDPYTKYLDHPSINSIPYHLYDYGLRKEEEGQWGEGHLICHLPGMTNEKRIDIFNGYIPLIQR
jgi:hypothetical protein